jgi:hypothetical protein
MNHGATWRTDGEYIELQQAEAGEFGIPCLFVADSRLAGRPSATRQLPKCAKRRS